MQVLVSFWGESENKHHISWGLFFDFMQMKEREGHFFNTPGYSGHSKNNAQNKLISLSGFYYLLEGRFKLLSKLDLEKR